MFEETEAHARRTSLTSPVLSQGKFESILGLHESDLRVQIIDATYDPDDIDLKTALTNLCLEAAAHVVGGSNVLVVSDRAFGETRLPIHSLLATGAIHHHLIEHGLRADSNLIVESGSARDSHQVACLLGFGATAVYPYLAYSVLTAQLASGEVLGAPATCHKNYRKGINKGLLKIMSRWVFLRSTVIAVPAF